MCVCVETDGRADSGGCWSGGWSRGCWFELVQGAGRVGRGRTERLMGKQRKSSENHCGQLSTSMK